MLHSALAAASTLSLTRHIRSESFPFPPFERNNLPSMYRRNVVHCRIFGSSVKREARRRLRLMPHWIMLENECCSLTRPRHLQRSTPARPRRNKQKSEQHSNKQRARKDGEKKQPQTMCILHSSPHHNSVAAKKRQISTDASHEKELT